MNTPFPPTSCSTCGQVFTPIALRVHRKKHPNPTPLLSDHRVRQRLMKHDSLSTSRKALHARRRAELGRAE